MTINVTQMKTNSVLPYNLHGQPISFQDENPRSPSVKRPVRPGGNVGVLSELSTLGVSKGLRTVPGTLLALRKG